MRDTYWDSKRNVFIEKDPYVQYSHARAMVDRFTGKDISCTVDDFAGRMHTPLTNMQSDLRHFLTHDGEGLVSIDIVNSQPYFSTMLWRKEIYKEATNSKKTVNPGKHIQVIKQLPPLMLAKVIQLIEGEEFGLFESLVSSNGVNDQDLYTYMMNQGQSQEGQFSSRAQVKRGMFEVFFSRNYYGSKQNFKQLFNDTFPSVSALFFELKNGDHKRLASLLQSIEAHTVLKTLTKVITKKNPTIPLFTIHDSIITTVQNTELVRDIIYSELAQIIGLPPGLKVEKWHPSYLERNKYSMSRSEF